MNFEPVVIPAAGYSVQDDEVKTSGQKSLDQWIEEQLKLLYEFRFNTITQLPEYKTVHSANKFEAMDDYRLNSIVRQLRGLGITKCSKGRVQEIIGSDFSPAINPIQDYFNKLPEWSRGGTDYIKQLADTVPTDNADRFSKFLKKWLTAVVAQVFYEGCANHLCLVLTGAQGTFKTTWLNNLCPLKAYLYCGKINPDNKDSLVMLGENLIVNIDDQLRDINKRNEDSIKSIITEPFIKVRKAYKAYAKRLPRLASIVASVNGRDFLCDVTGSRRFLVFDVIDPIDIDKVQKIDVNNAYAQAYYLYKSGFRYWLNKEEEQELNLINELYEIQSVEYEAFIQFFRHPKEDEKGEMWTTTQIKGYIEARSSHKLSMKRLGSALKKGGFERQRLTRGDGSRPWVYEVVKKSNPHDINALDPAKDDDPPF